ERDFASDTPTWSEEFCRLVGIDVERHGLSLSAFLDRVHPDDRALIDEGLEATRASGAPLAVDFRVVLDDGSERWLHGRAKRTVDGHGRPLSVSGTVQEITERKHAEAELRDALSLLN